MPTGAFNVQRLIAELGLKAVRGDEFRVLEQIQPTMNVGDLSDVTPPHVAPTAIFGALAVGAAGLWATVNLQCLAPGGGFIEWLTLDSSTTAINLTVRTVNPGGPVQVAPAGQVSRDPVVSIVRTGALAQIGVPHLFLPATADFYPFAPRPMFIPRGSHFILQAQTVTTGQFTWGFSWREVPASEHVPS